MSGYSVTLDGGEELYIPKWPASVALENLTQAGKFLGPTNLISMSELNTSAAILAITQAEDSKVTSELIKHFVCEARMNGEKILRSNYDHQFSEDLYLLVEILCHVVKAQYADFFKQGLAKVNSPSDSETQDNQT